MAILSGLLPGSLRNKGIRMKKTLIFLVYLLVLFYLSCSRQGKKEDFEWRGVIEYKNGIRVIKNPGEPTFGKLNLNLTLDLSLGSEEDENYLFYRIEDIGVDDQGNIYVLDAGNHRIQKYGRDGSHLQTIGRKGQGPGEFDTPYGMFVSGQGGIYIHDGMKVKFFNSDGSYLRETTLESFTHDISVDEDGNIWGIGRLPSEKGRTRSVVKLSKTGKLEKIIADFPAPEVAIRSEGGRGVMFFIDHEYVHELFCIPINTQSTLYAHSSEYSLHCLDMRGETELIMEKDERPSSISQREKDAIYEKHSDFEERWPEDVVKDAIRFPPHRPFFSNILADDKGRIYVERVRSILDRRTEIDFDIFSKDGYYLYQVSLPFSPDLIRNGYMYVIHSEEETEGIRIHRYAVDNWQDIRESLR
jgi:hypothetical protein